MKRIPFLYLWSLVMGVMDACTGILLATVPDLTLALMRVPPVHSTALVFISWMGVFITGVGLSYGLVFRGHREGETVWIFTAVVRTLVTLFVAERIASGGLPSAWALVAVADGVVAAVQWALVAAGWWREERG
jgi:hypothetical protein